MPAWVVFAFFQWVDMLDACLGSVCLLSVGMLDTLLCSVPSHSVGKLDAMLCSVRPCFGGHARRIGLSCMLLFQNHMGGVVMMTQALDRILECRAVRTTKKS